MTSRFLSDLDLRELPDGRWQLLADLCYQSALIGHVCAPAGLVTDLASTPRLPFAYWFYGDRARKPAVVHDHLYATRAVDRATADAVFAEAMDALGVAAWIRGPMWAAVRAFGWRAYRSADTRRAAMNPGLPSHTETA